VLGCLLLCLCQPSGGGPDRELLASASGWAAVWVGALGVGFAVELASPASIAARRAVGPDAGDVSVRLRWLVVGILLAALVRVLCPAVRRRADVGTVSAVTVAGLLVATGTGHGGSALSPTLASMALLAHVLAASAWTGGLLALVVHGRGTESADAGAATARAYSRIALVCYFVLAGSGLLGLLDRTGLGGLLDSHSYLAVVLAKTGLLLLLGLLGASQRRSGLARLGSGDRAGFLLLAVSELVLMAAAIGLGVTLAHTAA
jgi:putative copper resistance protein D